MVKLSKNWFSDGVIDFEYKRYILLAWLQMVERSFKENKLYPFLAELIEHYQNIDTFLQKKRETENLFPKKITKLDLENLIIKYEQTMGYENLMEEVIKILDYSMPAIKKHLDEGKEKYDWIEKQLFLRPLGIIPLQYKYGYVLIKNGQDHNTRIYNYKLIIFENAGEPYRGISTKYISHISLSGYTGIQIILMKLENLLSPPPVYIIESDLCFPLDETFLPIAKRILAKHLTTY